MQDEPVSVTDRLRTYLGFSCAVESSKRPLRDGDPKAIPVLMQLLNDAERGVRMYAAEALGTFGPKAKIGVPALAQLLRDEAAGGFGFTVSEKAAWSLSQIGVEASAAIPQLVDSSNCRHSPIRVASAVALTKIDPEGAGKRAIASLIGMAIAGNEFERSEAIQGLGEIGEAASEAIPVLVKALDDDSEDVRRSARTSLPKVSPKAAEEAGIRIRRASSSLRKMW